MKKILIILRNFLILSFMGGFLIFLLSIVFEDLYLNKKILNEAIDKKQTLVCSEEIGVVKVKRYEIFKKYLTDLDTNKTYNKYGCEPLN